ncbi:MAG TPA: homoserine O-succinyltransferase [Candidatus Acidoferrum sp.]|nr:homoserine O-succinyltransferase [Candidatus Acidoferrum sp.]
MPLVINGGRVPEHWLERQDPLSHPSAASTPRNGSTTRSSVRIALINNMPDAALDDTEAQFFALLEAAAGDIPVHVQLYYLPDVPRGERIQEHLRGFYLPVDDLWNRQIDGAIITGTEPRQRNLRDEPYWQTLAATFDWAERRTASTVLSCLAAHASVLHSDGIERNPLPDKQFGVFDYQRVGNHELTDGLPAIVRFPHSRWNEVRADALTAHGYDVLDQSDNAGVNLFTKKRGRSLFVHFQGHPEYASHTLLKEYRRDIRRFLKQERPTFPTLPHGYFDETGTHLLAEFRKNAEAHPNEEIFSAFPEPTVAATLQNSWHASAAQIYRNWLQLLLSAQTAASPATSLAPAVRA